jgi:hypothetical protein
MDRQHLRTASLVRVAGFACAAAVAAVALLAVVPAAHAASGDLAWRRQVVGPNNGSAAFEALTGAPKGGAYAAGYIFDATGDMLATRFAVGGKRLWLRSPDFPTHAYDVADAATTDRVGDLIVAGEVNYPSLSQEEAIVKYGPTGKHRWTRYYNDSHAGQGTELVTDARGNVYVTTSTASQDIVLIKYSPAGTRRWVRSYAGPGDDAPQAIAVDAAGNVYLTGYSYLPGNFYDIVTFKYDPAGHRLWVRRFNGQASGDDLGHGMAVTPAGAVYVAGQTTRTGTGADAVVLKYNTSGRLLWTRAYSGTEAFDDWFNAIALLSSGDVAATGQTSPDGTQVDVLTVRLSPGGHTRWRSTYDGPDSLADQGSFVAGGAGGTVYVAGTSDGATTGTDMLTIKYDGTGNQSWAVRYTGTDASNDLVHGLVVNGGGVYVAGEEASNSGTIATLLKYRP